MAILIAEDDKHINQVVCEYLKDAGLSVCSCGNGGEAQALIASDEALDLFILDIMMPERSGLELLRDIRANAVHRDKPVLMLTALSDEYTQLMSFEGLADDYVTKPFSPKVLVKRVQALLRRSGRSDGAAHHGALTVDADSYEVYEDGARVHLTLREFELLHVFIRNPRKAFTRQQLLNHAWGYDYYGDERIVDVHIKNLRKKLKHNLIATVKGVGYKLTPEEDA